MIKRVAEFALNQPFFLLLLVALFVAGGVAAFRSLPVEAFPDVTDTQVQVITLFPGRAAEEVEKQVTIPVEIGLSGIPHSVRLFSHTQFGLSFIAVTFDDAVDAYFSRQQVLERLRDVDLPPGVSPDLGPLATPIGEIYRYRMQGDTSPTELRTIQDWTVARQLKTVPGVADVVTYGGYIKQYQVEPDLARMKAYGVTLQQLFTALDRGSSNAGGGYVDKGEQQYLIRGIGMLKSSEDIGNIVVAQHGGTPVLIHDISTIETGGVPRQGLTGQDKEDDMVTGLVLMRKGENPSIVWEIKAKIETLNSSVLPRGVEMVPIYDRTWLIDTTLHTVFRNLAGRRHSRDRSASRLPGKPAGRIDRGADDSIVAAGHLYRTHAARYSCQSAFAGSDGFRHHRRRCRHRRRKYFSKTRGALQPSAGLQARPARLEAGRFSMRPPKSGRPTFFSMLIIITAHIPIFTLQRHEGRIFAPMAWTVTSALVGSLLFSLSLVPLLCYFFLRSGISEKENAVVRLFKRIYRPSLTWALDNRAMVVFMAVLLLSASVWVLSGLGSEFLPELNEGTMWVNINFPPASP